MANSGSFDGRARDAEGRCLQFAETLAHRRKPWLQRSAKSASLTSREEQVMSGLTDGLLYKEISDALHISFGTVKKNCNNIYRKFNVHNRTEAIRTWLDRGGH
jgi:DNA-binding NarL/FixJ family response regulator